MVFEKIKLTYIVLFFFIFFDYIWNLANYNLDPHLLVILLWIFRSKLLKKSSKTSQLFRLSSTCEKSSDNGSGIDIPKRINRSSTDILKVSVSILVFQLLHRNLIFVLNLFNCLINCMSCSII